LASSILPAKKLHRIMHKRLNGFTELLNKVTLLDNINSPIAVILVEESPWITLRRINGIIWLPHKELMMRLTKTEK
jgi:hypothetical protein